MGTIEVHADAVARGERFEFGENWRRFLPSVAGERIDEAARSLKEMLELESLEGLSVLDIGSGSGLFSLAALKLGAEPVHSFDFDPASVSCGIELKQRYAPHARWEIQEGSALDREYVESLGRFDVVYAWGALHHTGDLAGAMDNVARAVAPGGRLFISIYNDQGWRSRSWRRVKQTYNRLPVRLRVPFVVAVMVPRELLLAVMATATLRPQMYIRGWTEYNRTRGMTRWCGMVDWCGGYPFEVAAPEQVFEFYRDRGFVLRKLKTCRGGLGCNEFVFVRDR